MNELRGLVAVASLALTLGACSVESDADRAACTASGGQVVKETYPTGQEGAFARKTTEDFTVCKDGAGKILKVYDEAVTEAGGWSRPAEDFKNCQRDGGLLYGKTRPKVGKYSVRSWSYICVVDGAVKWGK